MLDPMRHDLALTALASYLVCAPFVSTADPVSLFDGRTFAGWEGDTNKTWRIENSEIVGGSLEGDVPRNEFLCTTREFTNFVLRLKFKLIGTASNRDAVGAKVRAQARYAEQVR